MGAVESYEGASKTGKRTLEPGVNDQNSEGPVASESIFSVRSILALALPALGSLVIEPVLILIDTLMIGHLGTTPLAGLSLASTILTTVVGVFVFLAYSTTGTVARALGAGDRRLAGRSGIQAMWLAAILGLVMAAGLAFVAPSAVSWMGAQGQVHQQAVLYLRSSAPGLVGMFIILAANGVLRGWLDTKTPLRVLAAGAVGNVAVNAFLIYGLQMGIVGAGIGVSVAQTGMAVALIWAVVTRAGGSLTLRPSLAGLKESFTEGVPLFVRTLALRAAILATTATLTRIGATSLAANQVANSIWQVFQFGLDSLAIAAQSLVGIVVGKGDQALLRFGIRRLTKWGVGAATVLGVLIAATSHVWPQLFTDDQSVQRAAGLALLIIGALTPLAGWAYILDGILIGANQTRFMAFSSITMMVCYLPALAGVLLATSLPELWAFIIVCLAYNGWMTVVRIALNQYKSSQLCKRAVSVAAFDA